MEDSKKVIGLSDFEKGRNLLHKSYETSSIEKGGATNHKYFKREGTPGNYTYYYTEQAYKDAKAGKITMATLHNDLLGEQIKKELYNPQVGDSYINRRTGKEFKIHTVTENYVLLDDGLSLGHEKFQEIFRKAPSKNEKSNVIEKAERSNHKYLRKEGDRYIYAEEPAHNKIAGAISAYKHNNLTLDEIQNHIDYHQEHADHAKERQRVILNKENNATTEERNEYSILSDMHSHHKNAMVAYKMAHAASKIAQEHNLSPMHDKGHFSNIRSILQSAQNHSKDAHTSRDTIKEHKDRKPKTKSSLGHSFGDKFTLADDVNLSSLNHLKGKQLSFVKEMDSGLISEPKFLVVHDNNGEEYEISPSYLTKQ